MRRQGGKIGPAEVRLRDDTLKQRNGGFAVESAAFACDLEQLPAPPDIRWPFFGLYSPLSAVLSEHGFVRLFNPCKGCCSLRLSDYLTSDIAGHDVMLATPPQYFAESLQHYLQSKGQSSKATSLCVLVNTNHALFPKWRSFLQGMKRASWPGVPGYAFWVDEPTILEAATVKLDGASNSLWSLMALQMVNQQLFSWIVEHHIASLTRVLLSNMVLPAILLALQFSLQMVLQRTQQ
jgi:hypothetical protein